MELLSLIESTVEYEVITYTYKSVYNKDSIMVVDDYLKTELIGHDLLIYIMKTIEDHMKNNFDSIAFEEDSITINSLYTSELNITTVIKFTELECIEELD